MFHIHPLLLIYKILIRFHRHYCRQLHIHTGNHIGHGPVSYTHLDVYKRQVHFGPTSKRIMIEYIRGGIAELSPATAVIDCNGLGYGVKISLNTYAAIQGKKECKLYAVSYTHLDVYKRQDEQNAINN